jgi:DNA-binding transcriptional ArsR family regulator
MLSSATASDVFQAIASPTRRALLDTLSSRGESSVTNLVATLDVTQSAVSQQLGVLKSAGLVEERADGRFRYYSLRPKPLSEVDAWVARYRKYMDRQLDALGRVLDRMPDEAPAKRVGRKRGGRRRQPPRRRRHSPQRKDRPCAVSASSATIRIHPRRFGAR